MQRVRIISVQAENSRVVSDQLRSDGFEVEIVSPGSIPPPPADFEITLNEYTLEEALTQIESQANANMPVFIASGCFGDAECHEKEDLAPLPDEIVTALKEAIASDSHFSKPKCAAAQNSSENAEESPVDEPVIEPAAIAAETQNSPEENLLPALLDAHDFRLPESVLAMSDFNPEHVVTPAELKTPASMENVAPNTSAGEAEHSMVPVQQSELIPQTEAGEEVPSDWPIWQPPCEDLPGPAVVAQVAETKDDGEHRPALQLLNGRRLSVFSFKGIAEKLAPSADFWKVSGAAAVIAVVVLFIGATYHKVRPLPDAWSPDEQPMPFAVHAPAQNTSQISAVEHASASLGVIAAAATAELVKAGSLNEQSPTFRSVEPIDNSITTTQPTVTGDADYVAKDTVIHFKKRPAVPRKTKTHLPGVKYYSDLR